MHLCVYVCARVCVCVCVSTSSLNVDHLGKPPDPPQQPLSHTPASFPVIQPSLSTCAFPLPSSPFFLQAGNAIELVLAPKLCNGFFVLCAFNWSFCCCYCCCSCCCFCLLRCCRLSLLLLLLLYLLLLLLLLFVLLCTNAR